MVYSGIDIGVYNVCSYWFFFNVYIVNECLILFNSFGEGKDEMIEFCKKYGYFSKDLLGWKKIVVLLVFEYGVLNNMFVIFVLGKFRGVKKWMLLFFKCVMEIFWRIVEVDMSEVIFYVFDELNILEILKFFCFCRLNIKDKLVFIILFVYV